MPLLGAHIAESNGAQRRYLVSASSLHSVRRIWCEGSEADAMMFSSPLLRLAEVVLAEAREQKLRIATAESCTGGLIGGLLTEIPGSSDVFDRGFIVYSNRAKTDMLNVPGDLIADMGAVSEAVARSMAEGAVENSHAHIAVAVTGVAGPGGGTK